MSAVTWKLLSATLFVKPAIALPGYQCIYLADFNIDCSVDEYSELVNADVNVPDIGSFVNELADVSGVFNLEAFVASPEPRKEMFIG